MSTPASAPSEMAFFSLLARSGSFSATARELDVTTPAISKRLALMEARLGVQLLNRTTRRISPTPEGEIYLSHARRILADIADMEQLVSSAVAAPKGLLRVNATLGFGRSHIAPLISSFVKQHPDMQVQLQLTVNPPAVSDDTFDVCVRFGEPPEARVIARKLAPNRRLLCAAPAYLARHGTPKVPHDLTQHNCIGIRQGDEAYGIWRLTSGRRTETVKVRGNLSTSDGEIAVNWALAGHGIVMRAEWDVARYLRSGRLRQVLENHQTPPADIHAVWPQRHQVSARVRAFVDYLASHFEKSSTRAAGLVTRW
ncbi:MAG: LysR family transcriptional regulator [Polaromonas sp.]|uniref:LysR family transcriptional regulator n=1 Tax=Polaromonas sp. TaxID=1869339 RepID=UPI00272F6959|nr:LysR family transcriptional regulator [Polaromonas sp.]MDP2447994.1 LysR family transcriptional regulator [Polaromonas sp.]MDP3247633.1 LysR family transcriptional regulator [Polaromonas sp.]MDP3757861.1 LysR family transcriptional regulator [Polaromonas sp.]MDP3825754.1 LysR family transcriptional regulator [Polaromonas sp.]